MVKHFNPSLCLTMLILFLDLDILSVSASSHSHIRRIDRHHKVNRLPSSVNSTEAPVKLRRRKTCDKRPQQVATPVASLPSSGTTLDPGGNSSYTTTSTTSSTTKSAPTQPAGGGPIVAKPANWPTATQAGAAPAATVTSAADPFLLELSKAYDNSDNPLFNAVYNGDMTYYGQGLGACGDTYNDSSFTAAVSMLIFDIWPGATSEQNRNPICGCFTSGRKTLSQAGTFVTAVKGATFVNIGGDGLLNCDPTSQCHVPLTATVKHAGKSIQVEIVDRCVSCKMGDMDLTPTAFQALADPALGRTDVEWFFNKY
jgi:hypothetical protein